MWTAMVLTTLLETFSPGGGDISCFFPGPAITDSVISVRVKPVPSLQDRPGSYRLSMQINDQGPIPGLVQPIVKTETDDILIRSASGRNFAFTIGLRGDGKAALKLMDTRQDAKAGEPEVRVGSCDNFTGYMRHWLAN